MSLHDELTAVQHCLDDLARTVGRLERSLAQLRTAEAGPRPPGAAGGADPADGAVTVTDVITITEAPYDATLWTDSDDEGLGVRGRHAP
ncbi:MULTISPECIES: hypothetical protein [unclassified Streptomyces]|uniref:hypothetical protein n=1 Tax=unclassified Streptomyces TaxID=2593676 RepID=UPI002DD7B6AB|nr:MULTISPECIES: hypothetical protein [unclassified Streptomyces]WSA78863.1 hypothetical protein OG930_26590 [Streptomyces sp. NBC_01799]WSF84703.1 hypothetical protein OIE70_17360 [Streptomyces sp. NBC_01744]WSA70367.1 hypothetical protein OIE65_27270 [Streptomyces sp. NBC_01800]WSC39006.1 hypothetical protein OHA08_27835 [Streptomyces sp. NBC_01763]WSC53865.1 hypothetical protein OG808_17270 [Streptomyces sp. NBC_01761]